MLETVDVACPYCGEVFATSVDCSAGPQRYIEDCQVCCQPIDFRVQVDSDGSLLGVEVRRDND